MFIVTVTLANEKKKLKQCHLTIWGVNHSTDSVAKRFLNKSKWNEMARDLSEFVQ